MPTRSRGSRHDEADRVTSRTRAAVLVIALAALAGLAAVLPVREWLVVGLDWIDAHRTIAWLAYVAVYIVATVLLVPGSLLTLAAGFLFGLALGVAVVSAGSVLGASCAFLVGRFFVRDWVAERVAHLPRFRALDRATASDGFTIVLLARLSPLFPFNLLNYGFGLTAVSLEQYFFASWLGMLPATILYVYLGTLAADLTALVNGELETGLAGRVLLVGGFAATLALTVLVTRRATRALGAELETAAREGDAERRGAAESSADGLPAANAGHAASPGQAADAEPVTSTREAGR